MSNARAETERRRRRRRSDSYRGYDLRLGIPQSLQEEMRRKGYVLGWKNDEKGKLHRATQDDDWDFVTKDELNIPSHDDLGFNAKNNSETDNRIRREVDSATSARPIFAYLLKKPIEFWKEDEAERTKRNLDLKRSLIQTQRAPGGVGDTAQDNEEFAEHSYTPREVQQAINTTEQRIRRAGGWPKGKPRKPSADPYERGDRA